MTIDEILELIDRKSETPHWDHKAGFEWNKNNRDHQLGLIRDMMAMANTRDGGVIVLGVENATYKVVGLSPVILNSLDQTDIGQMVNTYADPLMSFELQKVQTRGVDIAVIQVPEFKHVPIVCKDSAPGRDRKLILRRGALYARTDAAQTEEISSAEAMRQLLSVALFKRREELLRSIENIMKLRPIKAIENSVGEYERELTAADSWFAQVLQKGFLQSGRWEVVARPASYRNTGTELREMNSIVKNSQVELRGWPFPYIDHKNASAFNQGVQSFTDWADKRECFGFYNSGLFVWKGTMPEDLCNRKTSGGKNTLDVISTIYKTTEIFEFLKRLYEVFPHADSVSITVRLTGCRGRELVSSELWASLFGNTSSEDIIEREDTVQEAELTASADEMARAMARHIFAVFNWNMPDRYLIEWQDRFYGRSSKA